MSKRISAVALLLVLTLPLPAFAASRESPPDTIRQRIVRVVKKVLDVLDWQLTVPTP